MRSVVLVASSLLLLAAPAHAGGRCDKPYAPVIKVTPPVTKVALTSLRGDATSFIAASDVFQKCIAGQGGADAQIRSNQDDKERVARQINTLIRTYAATAQ